MDVEEIMALVVLYAGEMYEVHVHRNNNRLADQYNRAACYTLTAIRYRLERAAALLEESTDSGLRD